MIPPKANAEFVCGMEDVLDVYTRPYDPLHPSVCFDESNKQLVAETREPLPAEPGKPERYDYEYERILLANLTKRRKGEFYSRTRFAKIKGTSKN